MMEENIQYKTSEGKQAWFEAIEFLKNTTPLPALKKH